MNCECLNCCEPTLFGYKASSPATNNPPACGGGCVGNGVQPGNVVIYYPRNGSYYSVTVAQLDNLTLAPVLEQIVTGACASGSTVSASRLAVVNPDTGYYYELQVGTLDNQTFAPVAGQLAITVSNACGASNALLDEIIAQDIYLLFQGNWYQLVMTALDDGTIAPILEQTPV